MIYCFSDEQLDIFNEIMEAVVAQNGGVFFYMVMVEPVRHLCGKHYQQL